MTTKTIRHLMALCVVLMTVLMLLACGTCSAPYRYATKERPVYVPEPPPASKAETKPSTPSKEHVWVPGYFDWDDVNEQWKWIDGSWLIPLEGYEWQQSSYKKNENGDGIYYPGYWKRIEQNSQNKSEKSGQTTPLTVENNTETTQQQPATSSEPSEVKEQTSATPGTTQQGAVQEDPYNESQPKTVNSPNNNAPK